MNGRLPHSTLCALRGAVARAEGLRRSLIRVTQRPCGGSRLELLVRTLGDRWSLDYDPTRADARRACRYVRRRADSRDLP